MLNCASIPVVMIDMEVLIVELGQGRGPGLCTRGKCAGGNGDVVMSVEKMNDKISVVIE
ncbi:hypothetical protein KKF34_04915 [Myxococcota bacterium]|nr:hypothetical protein [Myxococcota bacterium]MBU1496201.1 hypothetical protein [Myxococcota bacterium]